MATTHQGLTVDGFENGVTEEALGDDVTLGALMGEFGGGDASELFSPGVVLVAKMDDGKRHYFNDGHPLTLYRSMRHPRYMELTKKSFVSSFFLNLWIWLTPFFRK